MYSFFFALYVTLFFFSLEAKERLKGSVVGEEEGCLLHTAVACVLSQVE